jgi:hypothetical protein
MTDNSIIPTEQTNSLIQQLQNSQQYYQILTNLLSTQFILNIDYGTIPRTRKVSLFKPGAQRLCQWLNLTHDFQLIESKIDPQNEFFYYHYRCNVYHQSFLLANSDGIAHSLEKSYTNQNVNPTDAVHRICQMSQKRAYVSAVIYATRSAVFFSQSLNTK